MIDYYAGHSAGMNERFSSNGGKGGKKEVGLSGDGGGYVGKSDEEEIHDRKGNTVEKSISGDR